MNTENQELEFERLKEIGLKLHVPIPETFLTMEVFDKDGNPVCPKCSSPIPKDKEVCPNCATEAKYHQRGHSWTRNAYNVMFSQLAGMYCPDATFGAGKLSAKTTAASVYSGNYSFGQTSYTSLNQASYGYRGDAGEDDRGIQVGSGTNAESFEDYVLQTPITNGVGAGQLSYIESNAQSVTYTAGTKVFKNDMIRYFNNNSGGNVLVNEIALTGCLGLPTHPTSVGRFVMSRDLLGATVTVADTGQLQVKFTIQITYPS